MKHWGPIQRCVRVRRGWVSVLVVWLAAVGVYASLASSSSLWDRDEPRFARAAVEMKDSGDWLVPRFNNELRPDKPILIYWLMVGGLWLLGFGEMAVRLPSVLAVPTAGAVTYAIARSLLAWDASRRSRGDPSRDAPRASGGSAPTVDSAPPSQAGLGATGREGDVIDPHRVGLWAMVVLLTSLVPVYIGTAATADGVLLLCVTASVWGVIEAAKRRSWPAWIAAGVALGLAQLTKGPVALGIVALMAVAMMAFGWRRLGLCGRFPLGLVAAVLLSIGMFVAWGWPANEATGGELAAVGLGRHVGERMIEAQEGHGGENLLEYVALLPAYVPMMMIGLGGWVMWLPLGVRRFVARDAGWPLTRRVLACWFVPGFVLFSLVATKLPHYVLPLYPAVAIWLGLTIERQARGGAEHAGWRRLGGWLYAGGAGVAVLGMWIVPWTLGEVELGRAAALPGMLLAFAAGGAVVWHHRHRPGDARRAGVAIALGTAAVAMLTAQRVFPILEQQLKPAPRIAEVIRDRYGDAADAIPVATLGYREPSLMFYLNRPHDRPIERFSGSLESWLHEPGPGVLILTRRAFDAMAVDDTTAAARVGPIPTFDIVNYADAARPKTVMVLRRRAEPAAPPPPATR